MKKFSGVILGIFIIWACAPRPTQPAAKPAEEEIIVVGEEEAAKPAEEAPIVEEGEVSFEEATPAPTTPTKEVTPPPSVTYGYRVQILATSNKEKADMFAKEAQARFPNQKVYVEFIPPYYKVRIGDFITREEAEAFRAKAKSLGYFDAFIVESQITPK
ncbi:MAG: SPOR domain-containing protein [candidate division WOR-3 bacterium]